MRPLLFAHRGASIELPENTIAAFARALELGADVLETDVQRTRDGHVLVFHDPTGLRVAGMAASIAGSTLAEIQAWDLGRGRDGGPFRAPTLDEVLARFPNARFNIDAKVPEVVEPLLSILDEHAAHPRVRLAAFSARTLRRIRSLGYRGETALGDDEIARMLALPPRFRLPGDAAQIPVGLGPLRLDNRWTIERAHAHSKQVHYWVIDEPDVARRLLDLGADGIMTNDPRRLAKVMT